jgi:tetratricopeptide (TPR) repeat protein/ubiquinone/menaquinone biosynthesis C-methylase UbiE
MNRRERRAAKARGVKSAPRGRELAEAGGPRELFGRAMALYESGDTAAAESICRQILAADSNFADALHMLGLIALQSGQLDMAAGFIERAIGIDDRNPDFHYNIGLVFGLLGRFEQSASHSLVAIRLKPDYPNAHLNLANALLAQGERGAALENYQRAAELDPGSASAHYNIGNMQLDAGEFDAAVRHYERALAANPGYAEARLNLGRALFACGKIDQAIAQYQQAASANPFLPGVHKELGVALRGRGKLEMAADSFRSAIQYAPQDADAHACLGAVLLSLGKVTEADHFTRQALVLNSRHVLAAQNLIRIRMHAGEYLVALGQVRRLWEFDDSATTRSLFLRCIRNIHFESATPELYHLVAQAMTEPWGRPGDISIAATNLIKLNSKVRAAIERVVAAWPRLLDESELTDRRSLADLLDHPLLGPVLKSAPIRSPEFEKFLTTCRAILLEQSTSSSIPDQAHVLKFHCALAHQCFVNEYVFALSEPEQRTVEQLRTSVLQVLDSGGPIQPTQVAALATYVPLHTVAHAERLLEREWPQAIDDLLTQQVREPRREHELVAGLPRLTSVDDHVSRAVQEQYEENPYPRWVKTAVLGGAVDFGEYWRRNFPDLPIEDRRAPDHYEILIAGCGTGQQAVEISMRHPTARILAIDLSRTSLAYAMRKCEELNIRNVEFAQADILKIGSIDRTFDIIYSDGVLHHLGSPLDGWRELLAILRPGGAMHVALYSELARTPIVEAQRLAVEQGYSGRPDEIRDFRQQLLAAEPGTSLSIVARRADLFSLSECRDLLFHRQEHRFTIPRIRQFLSEAGVEFAGFTIDEEVRRQYVERYPGASWADLANWAEFERDHPDTFISMYQFWVHKPAA